MCWLDPTTTEQRTPGAPMECADEDTCQASGCRLEKIVDACEHGYLSWAIVSGRAPALGGE